MGLFSESDYARIEAAIERVEQRSAAEFVVAVVPRSANYSKWRALVSGAWAVALSIAWFRFVPWGSELWAIALQLPVGLAVWALLGVPSLHRRLIPRAEAERAVQGAAYRLFAERGVHRTRDRTGMLMLISELEHRVVLLGDTGVDERVGREGWERHVEHVVRCIRDGRAVDGVLDVIERLEASLSQGLPPAPDDVNELPNQVVRDG